MDHRVDDEAPIDPGLTGRAYTEQDYEGEYLFTVDVQTALLGVVYSAVQYDLSNF